MAEHQQIIVERNGGIVEITLNNPEKMNALSPVMTGEIVSVLDEIEGERGVAGVLFQGSERAFCAGADLGGFSDAPEARFDNYRARFFEAPMRRFCYRLSTFTKPVISAVEGYCLGGGLELAMWGDLIVAGEAAQFGLPEARWGLIPGAGGTQNLPRLIGPALAKEMMWTGRRITAAEAKEFRLVNHVVPKGEAAAKAREIFGQIAENGPLAVMMVKQAVDRGLDMPRRLGFEQEGDLSFALSVSTDRKEGLAAFAERRKPGYKGE